MVLPLFQILQYPEMDESMRPLRERSCQKELRHLGRVVGPERDGLQAGESAEFLDDHLFQALLSSFSRVKIACGKAKQVKEVVSRAGLRPRTARWRSSSKPSFRRRRADLDQG